VYRFDEFDRASRTPPGALPDGQPLTLTMRYRRGLCVNAVLIWRADDGAPVEQAMSWRWTDGGDDVFEALLLAPGAGLYWYWFRIETAGGAFCIDRSGPCDESAAPYQLTVHEKGLKTPAWIKGGVMYHIFVDRYAKGSNREQPIAPGSVLRDDWGGMPTFLPDADGIVHNSDFFGGDLEGIIGKLPHLCAQGVTCLYLSPIFEAGSNHKYDTGDYKRVDPGFGNEEMFKTLCREAEAHGMRVVLDGVFNHVGIDSVYFNRYGRYDAVGAYQSKESPYFPWFTFREWPDEYESWWGVRLLPTIDKRDPSYRDFIAGEDGVVGYWMDRGAGGWRFDVVDELPDAFLDPLCAAIRKKDPDALVIGEVWEDASNKIAYGARRRYFLGGQLDSVMNYPLRDAIIAYVRNKNAGVLADTMEAIAQNYPKPILDTLMNILGTHDTRRILTALGCDIYPGTKEEMSHYRLTEEQLAEGKRMLRIAAALQFTLPGFPCVYYGDEAGMEGCSDPFNRVCYPWGKEDRGLVEWYRSLASIRASQSAFRDGDYRLAAARDQVFAFIRGEGEEAVLIAANVGEEDVVLPLEDFRYDQIEQKAADACVVRGKSAAIYTKGRRK
jgi:glycosidase